MSASKERVVDERFVLGERVGSGRMSSVFIAQDRASKDATVAIKLLNTQHPDEIKRELFKRETSALKRLRHGNIVGLRHSGWSASEQAFYLVLDYLPYSLDRYLKAPDRSAVGELQPYRIMRDLADALAHPHSENVVHRDIKPSNILLNADGSPMLTDFGISKLFTHLTVGETLAGFWSSGYAAPEQRAGRPVSANADVYSLGAVFFHMLSRCEPPPEGPTPTMVDDLIGHPLPIKNALKKMLLTDPGARFARGADVLSALEVTRRHEDLPQHSLILTRSAVRDLIAAGYSSGDTLQDVADVLVDDLGGMQVDEVHVRLDQQDERGLIVLGDTFRLVCTRNQDSDALVVKAIHTPYGPRLDAEKGRSMPYRALWMPVEKESRDDNSSSAEAQALRRLWITLTRYERVEALSKEGRRSRRDVIERWNAALQKNRGSIEKRAAALQYADVTQDSDYFWFTLAEFPPDDLDWDDDTRLATMEARRTRMLPVGNLIGIRGKVVSVAKQARQNARFDADKLGVPPQGLLTINVTEELAANTRQRHAVNAFLYGQMVNPRVADVIVDPSSETRMAESSLEYFQDWLSADKKRAVAMALSSNELFLIQGPPGTGKTAVIAEIVLQILKQDPEARILLTSQSNVAVDHALAQIAKAAPSAPPAMVRYGRSEKIGEAGRIWTLRRRVRSWRKLVLKNCDVVIEELRDAERAARVTVKAVEDVVLKEPDDGEMMEEWIAEARVLEDQLKDYEQELIGLESDSDVSEEMKTAVQDAVERTRSDLRDQVAALRDLLPEIQRVEVEDESEHRMLAKIVRAAAAAHSGEASGETPERRELRKKHDLRATITKWSRVAGLGRDFEELVAKSARVVAATCSMSGKRRIPTPENSFSWAIVDEAGRATVPEVLIPVVQAERTILVGDERQLPPMVDEELREPESQGARESLGTSLFQSIVEQVQETNGIASLRTQYRMHTAIGNLISAVFYDGDLKNGERGRARGWPFEWMPAAVTWLSTSYLPARSETRRGASFENAAEAEVVLELLRRMEKELEERKSRITVGVITGYSAQVERLATNIDPENEGCWRKLEVEIATVDSFQGRECDVVVYSTVRSNREHRIGFLRDYRRVNVALSRAQDLLVIVGDQFMMESASVGGGPNPFASVIAHMKSRTKECAIVPAGLARL